MAKYNRTVGSPYPKGSDEDRKLSADSAAYSKKNRANLARDVKDVVTGRAAWEGLKAVGRGVQKGFEAVDKRVAPNTYQRDKDAFERIQKKRKK